MLTVRTSLGPVTRGCELPSSRSRWATLVLRPSLPWHRSSCNASVRYPESLEGNDHDPLINKANVHGCGSGQFIYMRGTRFVIMVIPLSSTWQAFNFGDRTQRGVRALPGHRESVCALRLELPQIHSRCLSLLVGSGPSCVPNVISLSP